MDRVRLPVAVHLFLRDNEKVLLLRRYNTGYEDGNYSVIAGHIDGGEDVYAAMIREAYEEAGIIIKRENLRIVQVMHRKKISEERIDYFFDCFIWDGMARNMEPNRCDELKWVSIGCLPENTVDYIFAAIQNYRDHIAFSIFGW